ncbi:hypothetical protein SLEP1_g6709 [Rubroshorea leprosula]|uniref:Uncharacterized protein n=1 Tax=Rubroshorea leprosula TaxID=152421 RepID=A0AAV5I4C4_9ROSI|nr:hypothetical protein SLEP1_g6709 [Rubroshorea leprosula]
MEEEEGVVSVEPIAMIIPLELKDLPEAITLESSASSSMFEGFDNHHSSSSSKSLFSEATPNDDGGVKARNGTPTMTSMEESVPLMDAWENKPIVGKLHNIRKASQDLLARFRFRVALYHDMVDSATIVKGFKKLGAMVK